MPSVGLSAHISDFARLGEISGLTLAEPGLNRREKSGKDAGEWLPESNRCWFADRVVRVKSKYGLTVDVVEAAALESVLQRCRSVKMQMAPRRER